jgi:dTDP-L-rhamnose 4-epimerase
MKVLVTGGAGFIGSFIVDGLVEKGHDVVILDNLDKQVHPTGEPPAWLNKKAEFIRGDVRNKEDVKRAMDGVEILFHEGAAVGVGQSMYELNYYVDVNTGGTANILEFLANEEHSVKKMMVAASMSEYGEGLYACEKCGPVEPSLRTEAQMAKGDFEQHCPSCSAELTPVPTPETKHLDCNSVYALTKKDQEELVLMMGKAYGIKAVALRYFNVFGPRQSLSNPYTGVAAIFMSRIKNGNRPVIYEDGLQSRDFVSVRDIARANILAMEKSAADYEVFNVGTGNPLSIKQVAEKLAELQDSDIKPEITSKFRKGDVRHCFADISKIKSKLGYSPSVLFEDGMREIIEWSQGVKAIDKFEQAAQELKKKGLI